MLEDQYYLKKTRKKSVISNFKVKKYIQLLFLKYKIVSKLTKVK